MLTLFAALTLMMARFAVHTNETMSLRVGEASWKTAPGVAAAHRGGSDIGAHFLSFENVQPHVTMRAVCMVPKDKDFDYLASVAMEETVDAYQVRGYATSASDVSFVASHQGAHVEVVTAVSDDDILVRAISFTQQPNCLLNTMFTIRLERKNLLAPTAKYSLFRMPSLIWNYAQFQSASAHARPLARFGISRYEAANVVSQEPYRVRGSFDYARAHASGFGLRTA